MRDAFCVLLLVVAFVVASPPPPPSPRDSSWMMSTGSSHIPPLPSFNEAAHHHHGEPDSSSAAVELRSQTAYGQIVGVMSSVTVNTNMVNVMDTAQSAQFVFSIPETAYVTNFQVTVDGVTTVATVESKKEAHEQFDHAVQWGHTTGIVDEHRSLRGMSLFTVTVNLEAHADADFELTYEEALVKRLGAYTLRLDSIALDSATIYAVNTIGWESADSPSVYRHQISVDINGKECTVQFTKDGTTLSEDGRFVLQLTPLEANAHELGELLVEGDYFSHVFRAPQNLAVLPKATVFVLDVSGSMSGRRIEQAREALLHALSLLRAEDNFQVISFSTSVTKCFEAVLPATPENIETARQFAHDAYANGGTNIGMAMENAFDSLRASFGTVAHLKTVVLLTDGDANAGISAPPLLLQLIRDSNDGLEASVFPIGFGHDMQFDLLADMAYDNGGFSSRVFETQDTMDQLWQIFGQVNAPILADIDIHYSSDQVKDVTLSHFPLLFVGSELMVTGIFKDATPSSNALRTLDVEIRAGLGLLKGNDQPQPITVSGTVTESRIQYPVELSLVEASWAYLTVQQNIREGQFDVSLHNLEFLDTPGAVRALAIALERNMVTPVTSLVVVVPHMESVPEDPEDDISWNLPSFAAAAGLNPSVGHGSAFLPPTLFGSSRSSRSQLSASSATWSTGRQWFPISSSTLTVSGTGSVPPAVPLPDPTSVLVVGPDGDHTQVIPTIHYNGAGMLIPHVLVLCVAVLSAISAIGLL